MAVVGGRSQQSGEEDSGRPTGARSESWHGNTAEGAEITGPEDDCRSHISMWHITWPESRFALWGLIKADEVYFVTRCSVVTLLAHFRNSVMKLWEDCIGSFSKKKTNKKKTGNKNVEEKRRATEIDVKNSCISMESNISKSYAKYNCNLVGILIA